MRISSITRINFSITMLCVSALLFATVTGVVPDERIYKSQARAKLCESLAANASISVSEYDLKKVGKQLELFSSQNPELASAGLRRKDNALVVSVGDHAQKWEHSTDTARDGYYTVPMGNSQTRWGQLEVKFTPLYSGLNRFFSNSLLKLIGIVIAIVGLAGWLQLRRVLSYLDPSKTVPPRVRDVLNNFAEGVLVLDDDDRIVLANDIFADHLELTCDELIGTSLFSLPWRNPEALQPKGDAGDTGLPKITQLQLNDAEGDVGVIFNVNSSPVLDDSGNHKGSMLAFTDVTLMERNRLALLSAMDELNESKQAISEQNEELRYLATRDPLTSCLNRRTFFDVFQEKWNAAKDGNTPLCAMMVDIDFFKHINDNYGHSMGDTVLKQTGELLNGMSRSDDIVCRYGGEEFAVLMPGLTLEEAEAHGNEIRIAMSKLVFNGFTITASFGLSGVSLGAFDPQHMLDQADKCLYVAKRNGRNQVVRFDLAPPEELADSTEASREKPAEEEEVVLMEHPAVEALISTLCFRDQLTGMHCKRVASYASLLAQRVLPPREVDAVETGALLHEIGKVGLADDILLKHGQFSLQEKSILDMHDHMGAKIVSQTFDNKDLTDVVKFRRYKYNDDSPKSTQKIRGTEIPIGARILAIVDSFDSTLSGYPEGVSESVEYALGLLNSEAGKAFDPELVRHFVALINSGDLREKLDESFSSNNDVVNGIGDQVQQLFDAADQGSEDSFVAMVNRLRKVADSHELSEISEAATKAIRNAKEDPQIETLVKESFELLIACRAMRGAESSSAVALLEDYRRACETS